MTAQENGRIRVPVLLQHFEGNTLWSAQIPALEDSSFVPLADGETPEAAAAALGEVITDGLQRHPELLEKLRTAPEIAVTQIEIKPPTPNA